MKRFAVASMTVLAIGAFGLSACGGGEKVKELEGQVQTLTTKNQELEAKVAETQKMLDECKAAAPTPTPEATATPAATGKTPVKTPAKTATPAPATPTPTPTPIPTVKPELKTKLKIK